jgi:hypothetical protein
MILAEKYFINCPVLESMRNNCIDNLSLYLRSMLRSY